MVHADEFEVVLPTPVQAEKDQTKISVNDHFAASIFVLTKQAHSDV
jgi:hypothetical protein